MASIQVTERAHPIPEELQGRAKPTPVAGRTRFPLEFLDRIEQTTGPVWLVKNLMPASGLLVLYGASGSGKSFLALDVALHIAAGRSWAGCRVRQAGVIYVASEAGRGMRNRVLAAVAHHRFPRTIPFALITVAPDLGSSEGDARALIDSIAAQVPPDFRPGLIVLDTLARSMVGADESGSAGMGVVVANAEMIGAELNALVMPIHHAGKDVERGMRGSSSLQAASDAVWRLPPDGARRMHVEKMKEDAHGAEVAFDLRRVTLGVDPDGDEITTCIVEVGDVERPEAPRPTAETASDTTFEIDTAPPLSASAIAFLDALKAVLDRDGVTLTRFRHIPRDARVVKQTELKGSEDFSLSGTTAKSRKSRMDTLIRSLEALGRVRRHGGYLWIPDASLTNSTDKAVDDPGLD